MISEWKKGINAVAACPKVGRLCKLDLLLEDLGMR